MKQATGWQLLGVAAALLAAAGPCRAAVQGRAGVYWLGVGDRQLREVDGEPCLVPSGGLPPERLPPEQRHPWAVSVPTIKAPSGKYLGADPQGRDPSVHLYPARGDHTRWVVEFVDHLSPGRSREEPRLKEGPEGFTFRVKLAEGPFKDWYLAAEAAPAPEAGPDRKPAPRRLKLVRGAREATVFTYVETNYFVDHK
jgi:hypothetical protein